MSYLEGGCPFCHRAFNEWVGDESYVGKWVEIDVPSDLMVGHAVHAKRWLYKMCKEYNRTTKGTVKFNLDSLK